MDGSFFLIVGIVLFLLSAPWVLVWRGKLKRNLERQEDQKKWQQLANRVSALEDGVEKFQARFAVFEQPLASLAKAKAEAKTSETASAPALPPLPTSLISPGPVSRIATPAVLARMSGENWATERPSEAESSGSVFASDRVTLPSSPAQPGSAVKTAPSLSLGRKPALGIEEMLGTNWLNKLGVVILVLGLAFFLAYKLKTLGPGGKVLIGVVSSGAMLAAGIWFERKERYRILARAGIGGGWALLFFTSYAMYHVPAARVLSSQAADLVLMLLVAAVMVAHTLRYRSQVVTGLAFLLAFSTITISHSNVYSLSAGVVLAAGLVVIVGRMQWFELEIFGILASYLNHFLWLRPIIEPMHEKRHAFPEFAASAGILVLYWLVFRGSYLLRHPGNDRQERISTGAALLNPALLLALFKYQSLHPEWAFWALLVLGTLETLLGQLPITRRRRSAFIVLSTLGVVLLIAAFPFRYSGARLSVMWLLEGEALLLIGVWTREIVFRRLGMLACALVSGHMITADAVRIYDRRMNGDVRADFALAIMFVVAAAVFYANAHWVERRWAELFPPALDQRLIRNLSYAAAAMLGIAAWIALPLTWTAVAWCALGSGLVLAGRILGFPELGYQGNLLSLFSVIRILAVNLEATGKYHGLTLRLLTVTAVAAVLYVTSRWTGDSDRHRNFTIAGRLFAYGQVTEAAYTWAASTLLALVAWYELRPISVADAWAVGGLILLELGLTRSKVNLRLQAHALFLASFFRMFFVNLNAAGNPGEISPRFYSVVPLALGFFYTYWRLNESGNEMLGFERKFKSADLCCWLGTITLASLMRFEVPADWVSAAWAALLFGLLAMAWLSARAVFLRQGLLVALGVLFRTVLHNFYERAYFPAAGWESRSLTTGTVVLLLFASLPFTFRLRRRSEGNSKTGLARLIQLLAWRPEQLVFFIAVALLTALLAIEMRHGMVTLAWGLEGVAVFMLALWIGERSFRLTGLGLLLLCAGKILLVDAWRLNPSDRYLTFIVLGAALLFVSFLYTRNREILRRYL